MRDYLLVCLLSCISFATSLMGQCTFPTYESYGLICDEAKFLCGYEMDGYTGTLLSDKSPQPQPHPLCAGSGEADNIQWFSFVASDSTLELVIRYSDCTGNILSPGLQVGIFESCELESDNTPLGSIYCLQDINYTDIVLTPDPADIEIGQLYLLFIDGYAGSACDFEIDVIQGVCVDVPLQDEPCAQDCGIIDQSQNNLGCTGFRDTYTFAPSSQIIADVLGCNPTVQNTRLDSILCIEWEITPSVGVDFISSSYAYFDSIGVLFSLTVEWNLPGSYTIKPILNINPLFSTCQQMCECTDEVAYTTDISESTVVQLPVIKLCPGECEDFCGQTICTTGEITCFDRDQCRIEIQSFEERENFVIDLGENFICPGDCYVFQDSTYCIENDYEIQDATSCDTTFLLQLREINLSVDLIRSDNLINCDIQEAILEGTWSTNFSGDINSAWLNENGDTLIYGKDFTTTEDGNFTFVVWADGFMGCENSLEHTVTKDIDLASANVIRPF